MNKEDAAQQEQFTEPTAENINVGMMVTLPQNLEKKLQYTTFFMRILRENFTHCFW